MMIQLLLCYLVIFSVYVPFSQEEDSSTENDVGEDWENEIDSDRLFASKTSYRFIQNLDTQVKPPLACKAVQLNMVLRHGTRYPSSKDVRKFSKLMEVLKGTETHDANSNDLNASKSKWDHPFTLEQDKELTTEGDKEMYELGKRFYKRFPDLFELPLTPLRYRFFSSCKSRSARSAFGFALGLFENLGVVGPMRYHPVALSMSPCNDDPVLRFFDICDKYTKEVKQNPLRYVEEEKFRAGKHFQKILLRVKDSLGLKSEDDFDEKLLMAMFKMCAYQVGILEKDRDKSSWCTVFEKEDYKVLQYSLDLDKYYLRSAGFDITYKSSCPLLRDFLFYLRQKVDRNENGTSLSAVLRFSHGETLLPFLTLLGLFRDNEPLKADNFERMENRKFKTSLIIPFGGNVAFVLFKCQENVHKIQLYVNERLVKLPCCHSKQDCLFSTFEKCYKKVLENCNLNKLCDNSHKHLEL